MLRRPGVWNAASSTPDEIAYGATQVTGKRWGEGEVRSGQVGEPYSLLYKLASKLGILLGI